MTLSYLGFLEKIRDSKIKFKTEFVRSNFISTEIKESAEIMVEWAVSGMSGGSCWDDSNPEYFETFNESESLMSFDSILSLFGVDFTKHQTLYNSCVKEYSREDTEYYGNYTNYSGVKCSLCDLYKNLVNQNLI